MSNRRRTISAIVVAIGAIIYGVSPIDVIPELFVGPLGFGDDIAVWLGAAFGIWKLLSGRDPRPGGTNTRESNTRESNTGGVNPPAS